MAIIGSLNIGMSVVTGKLTKGLKSAQGAISGFANSAVTKFGALGAAIAGVAGAASLTALVSNAMSSIDEIGKGAQKLGVLPEQLSALNYAADLSGVSFEQLTGSMNKFNVVLGDAKQGSKTAQQAFARIGIDPNNITDAHDGLLKVADAINGIDDPAKKTAALVDIFGKSGAELLPLLSEGSEGIAKLEARAKELGIVFNETDYKKVAAANDAISTLKTAIMGVGQTIAIEVAPYVEYFANKLTESGFLGQDAAKWVVAGLEWIVTGIAYAVDSLKYFEAAWYAIKGVVGIVATGVSLIITALISSTVGAVNGLLEYAGIARIEVLDQADQIARQFTRGMADETAKAFGDAAAALDKPSAVQGVKDFFQGIRDGADEAAKATKDAVTPTQALSDAFLKLGEDVQKLTEDWQLQADTFGMSAREAELFKLAQAGATEEQLAGLKKLNEQLTANEEKQKLMDEGKSLTESLRTPLEKYQDEMKHLEELLAGGAITRETFDRAAAKAKGEVGGGEVKLAGAATAGSSEALSSLARAQNLGKNDPMNTLNKTNEDQLVQLKEINRSLRIDRRERESDTLAA